MHSIFRILTRNFDGEVRDLMRRRIDALERDLEFQKAKETDDFLKAINSGWTNENLKIVFILNSFYQHVIVPLAASANREEKTPLGREVPILYGDSLIFDIERNRSVIKMLLEYGTICKSARVPERALAANRAGDILFQLTRGNEW